MAYVNQELKLSVMVSMTVQRPDSTEKVQKVVSALFKEEDKINYLILMKKAFMICSEVIVAVSTVLQALSDHNSPLERKSTGWPIMMI
jgi:hypothetical protein